MARTNAVTARHYVRAVLAMSAVVGGLLSCSDSTTPVSDQSGTFFGPVATMASGSGRTYVILDRDGVPTDIGVAITEPALTDLPATKADFVFDLPPEAATSLFKHVVINWEPTGHGPTPYLVPHFDFHFYTITNAERSAIVLGNAELTAKMVRQPEAQFVPVGYIAGMASEGMGLHWRDPEAPELKGEAFTKTFIYGSYDGAFIFAEPMIAKTYLETKPAAIATTVKLPAQYASTGYHATSYTVAYDLAAKEHRVALSGLVRH